MANARGSIQQAQGVESLLGTAKSNAWHHKRKWAERDDMKVYLVLMAGATRRSAKPLLITDDHELLEATRRGGAS